jgi:fused signal recognition particle receptor
VPDYINEIRDRLSAVVAWFLAQLSSVERLGLTETFARLSFVERMVLIVAASQVVLLVFASLIEFSARKRRRVRDLEHDAHQEPHAARPEVVLAEEIASWPKSLPPEHAPPPVPPAIELTIEPAPAEEAIERTERAERVEPAPAEPAAPPLLAPTAPPPPAPVAPKAAARIGLGLRRTRENLLGRIRAAITGSAKLDEICEGLEEALIAADVGVQASLKLVEAVRGSVKDGIRPDAIREALKDEIAAMLAASERTMNIPAEGPLVVMLAGVNGAGKTTTVAKLAARMKAERGTVIVAAADTFRAAAIEQLEVWCGRVGVDLIKQNQGSDPAAVAFDAVKAAVARNVSTVLIDTAGRLQTKVNLMEELKKIARVAGRELPGAPHECWLVLDATTGQNALSQAKIFGEAVPLTGVVLAKLDSTAKGGVVIAIAEQLKLPVRFVGVGENIEDLRAFDPREFVQALFSEDDSRPEASSGSYAA